MESLVLNVMCVIGIVSSWKMIRGRNTVESVVYLVVVFCNIGGIMVMMEMDFLGMTVIMIYVGAIAVLFLFVVMMLGGGEEEREQRVRGKKEARRESMLEVGGLGILLYMWSRVDGEYSKYIGEEERVGEVIGVIDRVENIENIGEVMYTVSVMNVLIGGGVLLVGLIGAVVLVKR